MYRVQKITTQDPEYPALRSLWCKVFGDEPEYVNAFYKHWEGEIFGLILSDDGGVRSALTCFKMGALGRQEVWISYAICTDPSARGLGYGSIITEYARDMILSEGSISMLCPAEPSLVRFYEKLGYSPSSYTMIKDKLKLNLNSSFAGKLEEISTEEYFILREKILVNIPHIELEDRAKEWIEKEYDSFYRVESTEHPQPSIFIPDVEFLPECAYSADYVQAMIAGCKQHCKKTYLGFAFD